MTTAIKTVAVELTPKDLHDLRVLSEETYGKNYDKELDVEMTHEIFRAGIQKLRDEQADAGYAEYAKIDGFTSERRAARRI